MYISHSVMDRLGVKATNSKAKAKAKARGVKAKAKAKDLAPKAKAKDTPVGLEAPRGQGRGLEDSISGYLVRRPTDILGSHLREAVINHSWLVH